MRYDSDPQVVKRILTEVEELQDSLSLSGISEDASPLFFQKLEPSITPLLNTLDHLSKLHVLNPQFSLSRFSGSYIERALLALRTKINQRFTQRTFANINDQVEWNRIRFLAPHTFHDSEQLLITLYQKIAQLLESYYVVRVRESHFAALLNEFVGWTEHIETHGHHDVHAVILFAEKIVRDSAVIEHRTEVVRDICLMLEERVEIPRLTDMSEMHRLKTPTLELSRVYSPYLLELYEALLEDLEIVTVASRDSSAFDAYCHEHDIDVYEEYQDVINLHLNEYARLISAELSSILRIIKLANFRRHADRMEQRYADVDLPSEILGRNLSQDIHCLKTASQQLKPVFPDRARRYARSIQKIKRLKAEIMKPAIQVYGEYLKNPEDFFHLLPQKQSAWIPILDSALACLEHNDDLYQKCSQLKALMIQQTTI